MFIRTNKNTECYTICNFHNVLNSRLQGELGKKQAELSSSLKDYKNLENRLLEQQRKEEEIHRKATFTVSKY